MFVSYFYSMLTRLLCRQIVYSHEKESLGRLSLEIKAGTKVIDRREKIKLLTSWEQQILFAQFLCKPMIWELAERSLSGKTIFEQANWSIKENFHCLEILQKSLGIIFGANRSCLWSMGHFPSATLFWFSHTCTTDLSRFLIIHNFYHPSFCTLSDVCVFVLSRKLGEKTRDSPKG